MADYASLSTRAEFSVLASRCGIVYNTLIRRPGGRSPGHRLPRSGRSHRIIALAIFYLFRRHRGAKMAETPNLPYVLAPGRIGPLLQKIQQAQTPIRFTQDFLETKLGLKGGSATPLIPLLKRIGLLENDGSPTDLYRKFRNPDTSGIALAQGIKKGYGELYTRNEYAHDLSRDKLVNLIVEITGKQKDDRVVTAIVATFWTLKELADFESEAVVVTSPKREEVTRALPLDDMSQSSERTTPQSTKLGLNLAYTINIVLPETDDINVYNAIFKSLKENMLRD
jgi:hypothetical protein